MSTPGRDPYGADDKYLDELRYWVVERRDHYEADEDLFAAVLGPRAGELERLCLCDHNRREHTGPHRAGLCRHTPCGCLEYRDRANAQDAREIADEVRMDRMRDAMGVEPGTPDNDEEDCWTPTCR